MTLPHKSNNGIWRNGGAILLTDLQQTEGAGRREPVDFTLAEMKRLNAWLRKHRLNVDKRKWEGGG